MTSVADRLEAVYARLPDVNCQGRCQNSCTVIDGTTPERDRLAARGFPLGDRRATPETVEWLRDEVMNHNRVPWCPALSDTGRCQVYDARPFICRLYGATPGLRCEHGCLPDRWLTHREVQELFDELRDIEAQDQAERSGASWTSS